jgi:hypothetical protein
MPDFSDGLDGDKTPGELIRSFEWNQMVAAIRELRADAQLFADSVNQRFENVGARLGALETRVEQIDAHVHGVDNRLGNLEGEIQFIVRPGLQAVQTDLATLKAAVEPTIRFYNFRLNLKTTRSTFALGELAEISATVTDLAGNALTFPTPADRPWIDFITPWGQLQAVQGFESMGGQLERTLSIRVNDEGVARVRLHAEHVWGVNDAQMSSSMESAMAVRMADNRTVAEHIVSAATPTAAKSSGAFQALVAEYDRPDATSVKNYIDAQYVKTASIVGDPRRFPWFPGEWRDYRTTVIAFAKSDSDPLTPDPTRGVSSIQVTFRDWIYPWVYTTYVEDIEILVTDAAADITRRLNNRRFHEAVGGLKDFVKEKVDIKKGVVHNLRSTRVVKEALNRVNPPAPPVNMPIILESAENAVMLQQTLILSQAMAYSSGPEEKVLAMELFTAPALSSEAVLLQAQAQIDAAQTQNTLAIENATQAVTQHVTQQVGALGQQVATMNGRVEATLAEGGDLSVLRSNVLNLHGKVDALGLLDPSDVHTKLSVVNGLMARVESLEHRP